MLKAFEFCLPTKSTAVPNGRDWLLRSNTTVTGSDWSATATACA